LQSRTQPGPGLIEKASPSGGNHQSYRSVLRRDLHRCGFLVKILREIPDGMGREVTPSLARTRCRWAIARNYRALFCVILHATIGPNRFAADRSDGGPKLAVAAMSRDERAELLAHLTWCRNLLALMRDPAARKTIKDLIAIP
jgi:hypothetical protein